MTRHQPPLRRTIPLLALVLACRPADEPNQESHPQATKGPVNQVEAEDYMGSAGGLAARAADPGAVHREGPWTPVVYARDPGAPAPTAVAEALSAKVVMFEGSHPAPCKGELALIWLEPDDGLGLDAPSDPRRAQDEGAVVAILAPGDPAWSERAAQRLPWASMGVLDSAISVGLWADPALALADPRIAGLVAARELADHYALP